MNFVAERRGAQFGLTPDFLARIIDFPPRKKLKTTDRLRNTYERIPKNAGRQHGNETVIMDVDELVATTRDL